MNADHPTDARPILVFATHNPNKVRELQEMLGDQYQIQSLTDIGCHEEIVEDGSTLEGNAQIKARHVVEHYGLDCFADDTGLEVDALDGAPGSLSQQEVVRRDLGTTPFSNQRAIPAPSQKWPLKRKMR